MTAPLACDNCGTQGWRYRRGLCGPCALIADLRAVLDNGDGGIRPELVPFFEGFRIMTNPRAGIQWIRRPHIHQMLRTLADPATPITHQTLDEMSPWRSVAYLRDLLMLHGVLPRADRHLLLFQRWLRDTLTAINDLDQQQVITRFATWHVLHRLRRFAELGPVTEKQTDSARIEVRQAIAFLNWLSRRQRDLPNCGQADIDAWYADAYIARRRTHAFLRWAMRAKLLPRATIPHQPTTNPAPISQHQRLAVLRRLLTEQEIPLLTRVAALLVLLFAQPLTRILRLTTDDVSRHDGQVTLRLGDPPTPIPQPFAELLLAYLDQRLNLTTATNQNSRWLFPGRRGGQPMTPDAVKRRLRDHQIPVLNGRTSALRHLVLQAPAPVIARMLGYSNEQTSRVASEAGSPWSRYAPVGEHDHA
jgi:site-specific recombinase XerD